MRNVFALSKVLLRSLFDSGSTTTKKSRKRLSKVGYAVLILLLGICVCLPLGFGAYSFAHIIHINGGDSTGFKCDSGSHLHFFSNQRLLLVHG